MPEVPVKIDILILSYAKNEKTNALTIQTIETLLASENPAEIRFNVLVIESNRELKPYQFKKSTTVYPDEAFGFHRYFNIGIRQTTAPYVCLCNNDLIFHKGWATEILRAMNNDMTLLSAHPSLPGFKRTDDFKGDDSQIDNYFGVLFGWCIFVKRELFNIIGPLDEKLEFWYSDQDYSNTLKKFGVKNNLIETSIVNHLGSGSWDSIEKKDFDKLTQLPRMYYSYKWHHHSYLRYVLETWLYKLRKKGS